MRKFPDKLFSGVESCTRPSFGHAIRIAPLEAGDMHLGDLSCLKNPAEQRLMRLLADVYI